MNSILLTGSPYPLDGILAFAWMGIFLLIGMLLRGTVPLFKKYLIPACIIGGVLGLVAQACGILRLTGFAVDNSLLQLVVFHLFNLTWIFLGLKMPEKASGNQKMGKTALWLMLWLAAALSGVFVAGIGSSALVKQAGLYNGPASLGGLTTFGFFAGPGQTMTMASIWEKAGSYSGIVDFALASSSAGFAVAIVAGIFFMNIIARRRNISTLAQPTDSEECGFYCNDEETREAGRVTTSATNIDVLAWHLALGFVCYFAAYSIAAVLIHLLPPALIPIIWTLFFLICCLTAMAARALLTKAGKKQLCCNGVNARISNTLVDFLVCGTFISIEVGNVWQYMAPFLASIAAVTLVTSIMCWYYFRKLKHEGPETFAFLFGTTTGTVSTGLILLRMIDPENKSTVPVLFAVANSFLLPFSVLYSTLIHMEVVYGKSIFLQIGVALVVMVVCMILMRFIHPEYRERS